MCQITCAITKYMIRLNKYLNKLNIYFFKAGLSELIIDGYVNSKEGKTRHILLTLTDGKERKHTTEVIADRSLSTHTSFGLKLNCTCK